VQKQFEPNMRALRTLHQMLNKIVFWHCEWNDFTFLSRPLNDSHTN